MHEDGGAGEAVDESGADDADDAGVPVFVGEDDGSFVGAGHALLLGHFEGLFEDALFCCASVVVECGELVGEVGGALAGGGGHEFEGTLGVSESSDGVEAGGEAEADGFGVDLVGVEIGGVDECVEALDGGGFDFGQAELGDGAVFVDEGDDIGDGAQGGEGEEVQEGGAELWGDCF